MYEQYRIKLLAERNIAYKTTETEITSNDPKTGGGGLERTRIDKMVRYLDTKPARDHLRSIINEATEEIVLISPYLGLSEAALELIQKKSDQGIRITIVFGKKKQDDKIDPLMNIKNVRILFLKNLHAKCYYNQDKLIITSMNLYDFSMKNNIEMGILIEKEDDPKLFREITNSCQSIIIDAGENTIKGWETKTKIGNMFEILESAIRREEQKGYCIRCGTEIEYNTKKPYCPKCYETWSKYKNPDYTEKKGFCHSCGNPFKASANECRCKKCQKIKQSPPDGGAPRPQRG
jgi:phosphatidylserine/phosphatidylglycerophosphate/cardiolipin synthase-like enzyme